jgi:very-short-patch-repair endonuclease
MKTQIVNPKPEIKTSASTKQPSHGMELKKTQVKILTIKNVVLKTSPITNLPGNPKLKQRATALRQAKNLSEVLFWMQVTKGKFYNIDFDRQRIIGNYIVDFYIKQLALVIEIDGSSHDTKIEYDERREDYLMSLGLKIYRIKVKDIMQQIPRVMAGLEDYIIEHYESK